MKKKNAVQRSLAEGQREYGNGDIVAMFAATVQINDQTTLIRDEIRSCLSLVDIAEGLGVQRRGNGWLCPFHADHNPSFGITRRGYKCFACGASGDAITLVRELRGMGYRDALTYLADYLGIVTPWHSRGKPTTHFMPTQLVVERPEPEPESLPPLRRFEVLTWFGSRTKLHNNSIPCDYLTKRGISHETVKAAGVGRRGMAYDRCGNILKAQFKVEELQHAGLFNEKGKFRLYKHTILFWYWLNGECLGLQARNPDWTEGDGPKEITIGPVTIPYGCDYLTDMQEEVFITEGAIDALSLRELGLVAVGIPGASNFKPEWVELFDSTATVVLALDKDDAGKRGAAKIAEAFKRAGRDVQYMDWPDGIKDANEYLQSQGGAA